MLFRLVVPAWRAEVRIVLAAALSLAVVSAVQAETTVRVGWCANTVSGGASPFAIAQKMGWFEEKGVKVVLTPLPGASAVAMPSPIPEAAPVTMAVLPEMSMC
jgi:ABC-type nitrate/sulfonate/bicarbonate transport system substrate-binding protein